jgi:hypothetical protein
LQHNHAVLKQRYLSFRLRHSYQPYVSLDTQISSFPAVLLVCWRYFQPIKGKNRIDNQTRLQLFNLPDLGTLNRYRMQRAGD